MSFIRLWEKRENILINEKKQKLIAEIEAKAIQYEMNYHGCGQSVIASLQEKLNIGNEASFMAGSFLGAGVARSGETCGALIGAIMVIGLVRGRRRIDGPATHLPFLQLAGEVRDRFRESAGHSLCSEIQKLLFGRSFNLCDENEKQSFENSGGHSREGCPSICGKAARIAAEIIVGELNYGG